MNNNSIGHTSYAKLPMPGGITRFLWNCAGADKHILENCTYADHVKYACLGGIVLATGLMAALAGGYAFYTIFEPKGSAIEKENVDILTSVLSIIFGLFWGFMIFNLDRFIISSTGKGDGKETIGGMELVNALPRLLMGMVIAFTISKPVEIRMFKSEIDAKLYEKQLELQKEYEIRTNANFTERLKVVDNDLGKIGVEREAIIERVKKAEQAYTDNLMGKANGVSAGDGPLSKALKSQIESLNAELARYDEAHGDKLKDAEGKRKQIMSEKETALKNNVTVANGLDGLLERIKLAHEIAGTLISTFITLLFMSLELSPIFFKLMMTKSPYDYLDESHKLIILAKHGIYKENKLVGNQEIVIDKFAIAKNIETEKLLLLNSELDIKKYIIEKQVEKKKAEIDANPDNFIEP